MIHTNTLIIGASVSGLASAAALQKQAIDFIIIEKAEQVATPWRNHYDRLHLHTSKRLSHLPYLKFGNHIPRYPTRRQVLEYLELYQQAFGISPEYRTEALSVCKEGESWLTTTSQGTFSSQHVIIATGAFQKPVEPVIKGRETFVGTFLHSSGYKNGRSFKDQQVLIIGFGNSACEIAIDLHEQGAIPAMSVRSAVNVIPRDILGIPVLQLSLLMEYIPPVIADAVNAPLIRWLTGDIKKLGLKKLPYGPLQQIQKTGTVPVLDLGTLQHIREGHIRLYGAISYIYQKSVHFLDGSVKEFDAIIAATGYERGIEKLVKIESERFEDLLRSTRQQRYFGRDGLYFCGFWIAPTGQLREIGIDALKIAKDIAAKQKKRFGDR